jgi:hypothetical protein
MYWVEHLKRKAHQGGVVGISEGNIITDHTELDSENGSKTELAQDGRGRLNCKQGN